MAQAKPARLEPTTSRDRVSPTYTHSSGLDWTCRSDTVNMLPLGLRKPVTEDSVTSRKKSRMPYSSSVSNTWYSAAVLLITPSFSPSALSSDSISATRGRRKRW